jgi:hypothetical protein
MVQIRKIGFIWMAAFTILMLASVTRGYSSLKVFGIDIMFHIGIYTVVAFLTIMLFRNFETIIVPVSVMIVSALFFEILHGTINGYGFENGDYLLNNLGILVGTAVAVAGRWLFGNGVVGGEQIGEPPSARPGLSERGERDIL